jgi:hypothetical protein
MESKGLGDSIDKITTATGIKKAVKYVFGDDCGCDERRQKLNKLLPYKSYRCLTEKEFMWCKGYFNNYRSVISRDEQHMLLKIHNRVFKTNKEPSSCSSCVKDLYNTVNKLYTEYEKNSQE